MANDPAVHDAPVTATAQRTLRSLDGVRPLYMLPADPLAEEVLIPGFQAAGQVDCMVGFFSSAVLSSLAPGLATYVTDSENSFRLIVSPLLRAEDQAAIEDGLLKSAEELADRIFDEFLVTEDLLQRHTLQCLSWLLREKRIEIKVALMKDALFHPKVWLFENSADIVAAHGSGNATHAGIRRNIEQIVLSRSWQDPNQRYITDKLRYEFGRLWDNKDDNCLVIAMPEAARQRLLRTYSSDSPPTEDALRSLYGRAAGFAAEPEPIPLAPVPRAGFAIPARLRYEDGPFAHQGHAVNAWCEARYRGVLEMATGSGKTITAMISAHRLYEGHKPLLIVVAAPHVPLIEQWCDELVPFGLGPVNLRTAGSAPKRAAELQKLTWIIREGGDSGGDTGASVWYKRCAHKRLATTETPA